MPVAIGGPERASVGTRAPPPEGSDVTDAARPKITVPGIAAMKSSGELISMITAYDATFATMVDEAGIDMILVGDSVAMVVQGRANTIGVSLAEMCYHVRMVAAAAPRALIVGDLPFGTYQSSPQQAVESSVEVLKAGAEAVKLEGGVSVAEAIAAITAVDIPVVGHIGLTPQSYHRMGGHRVQGRTEGSTPGGRERLLADAAAVEDAGAFALVVEGVPRNLAAEITEAVGIPTIGIGAGPDCDGQVLVLHDVLGLSDARYKFTTQYANLKQVGIEAVRAYCDDVKHRRWPDDEHSFH